MSPTHTFKVLQPWPRVFGLAAAIFFIGNAVRLALPGTLSRSGIFTCIAVLVVGRLLVDVPDGVRRMAGARRRNMGWASQLAALIPIELAALFQLERATQRAFVAWLCRRPPMFGVTAGQVFEHHRKSQYSTVFIIVLIMCVTEVPLSFLLLDVIVSDPVLVTCLHWFLVCGTLYTLVLLAGDRHLVWSTRHVVAEDGLRLRVGERFAATIPWGAVSAIGTAPKSKELSESRDAWLRRNGIDPSETVIGTPLDQPNVVIDIEDLASVWVEKFRMPRSGVRHILIYVDEPAQFIRISGAMRAPGADGLPV